MALAHTGLVNQQQIEREVKRVRERLGPEVVHIRHSLESNASGEAAIYFRVVLTDEASQEKALGEVAAQIKQTLFDELMPYETWGLWPYFFFRSASEHARFRDPAWV